jgi:hypothetical protein
MNIVTVSIPRHKTAIRRSHLSRPIKCALVKTDPVDAAKLLNLLCRYHGGEQGLERRIRFAASPTRKRRRPTLAAFDGALQPMACVAACPGKNLGRLGCLGRLGWNTQARVCPGWLPSRYRFAHVLGRLGRLGLSDCTHSTIWQA